MDWDKILNMIIELGLKYGLNLVYAVVILIGGLWFTRILTKMIKRIFEKRNIDENLVPFLINLINWTLKTLVVISVLSTLGIQMTSFVAILGAAGLAIGMALSGTLQNFAGGVILLLIRPFKVGDYIEAQGYAGTVKEIQIFNTILLTPDNKTVVLANGPLSTNTILNFSTQDKRRVEWIVGISYGDDFEKARSIILDILNEEKRILQEPDRMVELHQLAESSVNIIVRAWVLPKDYWDVYFKFNKDVYKILPQNEINFPFPQMDLNINSEQLSVISEQ